MRRPSISAGFSTVAISSRSRRLISASCTLILFALDLLDFHGLSNHLLLHDVGFDFVTLSAGLRLLGHFQELAFFRSRSRWASAAWPAKRFRRDAFLVGLGLGDRGGPQGFGALDGNVPFSFGGGHFGIAANAGDVRPAHVGDVVVLVAHFLDGEADDFQPHLGHVAGVGGTHTIGNHFRFLDDLFHRQLADDAAQVSFHHQANQAFALRGALVRNCSAAVRMDTGSDFTFICATASTVTATPCWV